MTNDCLGNPVTVGDYITFPARTQDGATLLRFGKVNGRRMTDTPSGRVDGLVVAGIYKEWDGPGFGDMNYTFTLDPRKVVKIPTAPKAMEVVL